MLFLFIVFHQILHQVALRTLLNNTYQFPFLALIASMLL